MRDLSPLGGSTFLQEEAVVSQGAFLPQVTIIIMDEFIGDIVLHCIIVQQATAVTHKVDCLMCYMFTHFQKQNEFH